MNVVTSGLLETLALSDGYAALGAPFVERRDPTPLPDVALVAFNADVAELVGLDPDEARRAEFVRLAAGNARFARVAPFAAVYAGHQFGTFVPQLGDGRAISLGELRTPAGDRMEWQLKGAGPTAFSRSGDGRAVLRSTIREYLCSEAMHALGIPTTRALAIAGSTESVYRESVETAAVLTRVAPSLLRFGTFEYFAARGDDAAVRTLADYAIERFFPDVAAIADDGARYAAFLHDVVRRTARLVAAWQAVGFAHGVMNTDNMSILGLTLDYGPFGFLDAYDVRFICNHTDSAGRYAFDQQPAVGLWNCHALAGALTSLVADDASEAALAAYAPAFRHRYAELLYAKFGLAERTPGDATFFGDALGALQRDGVDHTNFFRALSSIGRDARDGDDADARTIALFTDAEAGRAVLARYRARLAHEPRDDDERRRAMRATNPKYVLRNYLAEGAIRAATVGDYAEIARLQEILRAPFDERPDDAAYAAPPPAWAHDLSVSCSS